MLLSLSLSLSLHFNGHFSGEPGLAGVYWSKGWWRWWWQLEYRSYKSCKAPVKSSPPTNQHPILAGCPSCRLTNSVKALKGYISHSMDLLTPSSSGGLPTLTLTTNSSWLPWGGLPCLSSSALWCQYPIHALNSVQKYRGQTRDVDCRPLVVNSVYTCWIDLIPLLMTIKGINYYSFCTHLMASYGTAWVSWYQNVEPFAAPQEMVEVAVVKNWEILRDICKSSVCSSTSTGKPPPPAALEHFVTG